MWLPAGNLLKKFPPSGGRGDFWGGQEPQRIKETPRPARPGDKKEEREIRAEGQRLAGTVFLILSCLIIIESLRLSLDTIHNPGPGFFPFLLGITLAALSAFSILSPDERPRGAAFWKDWREGRNILYIFAGFVVYMLLFKILGFYIDTFLLLIYLMKLSGERGYRRSILISLGSVAVIYIFFFKLLIIPFPRGILGI